jgi:hypothetical protein
MTPKLVKLTDLCRVLGLPSHRLEYLARNGEIRASRCSALGWSRSAGHYYVTTTAACRILREMLLDGADYEAGRRAVYRAAKRTHDSTHNTGLHEVGSPINRVKPGTE